MRNLCAPLITSIASSANMCKVKEWLKRISSFFPNDFKTLEEPILELDSHLTLRSHVVGYNLTVADLAIWGAIRGNKIANAAIKKGAMLNVSRWFKFIEETNPWISEAVQALNAHAQEKKAAKSKEGGSFEIALPDTGKGVITRFPPEPSYVTLWVGSALQLLIRHQGISAYWPCEGCFIKRLLRP